ncbi:stage V sporulation protein T [Priestia megaterium]|nr:stage V sporulation protein T [Priestia megaterium]
MRATGIVRRIDDLGRVVIPKEIRRTLRISEGDPLEIYVDNNQEIIFKKYQPFRTVEDYAQGTTDALYDVFQNAVFIMDEQAIVAVSGHSKKEILNSRNENVFPKFSDVKESMYESKDIDVIIGDDTVSVKGYVYAPIKGDGRNIGGILVLGTKQKISEATRLSVDVQSKMLQKQVEGR